MSRAAFAGNVTNNMNIPIDWAAQLAAIAGSSTVLGPITRQGALGIGGSAPVEIDTGPFILPAGANWKGVLTLFRKGQSGDLLPMDVKETALLTAPAVKAAVLTGSWTFEPALNRFIFSGNLFNSGNGLFSFAVLGRVRTDIDGAIRGEGGQNLQLGQNQSAPISFVVGYGVLQGGTKLTVTTAVTVDGQTLSDVTSIVQGGTVPITGQVSLSGTFGPVVAAYSPSYQLPSQRAAARASAWEPAADRMVLVGADAVGDLELGPLRRSRSLPPDQWATYGSDPYGQSVFARAERAAIRGYDAHMATLAHRGSYAGRGMGRGMVLAGAFSGAA